MSLQGYRQENIGADCKVSLRRPLARGWAKVLLGQLMQAYPDANEFHIRLIPKPDKTIDVEVTLGDPDSAGDPIPRR